MLRRLLAVLALALFSFAAWAGLTPAQLVVLKADIQADPVLASKPMTADAAIDIAVMYNQTASPAYIVWKTVLFEAEIINNGFDWVRVDNLSVGKARIWDWMFRNGRAINCAKPNVRAGIQETWKGTAADLAVQAAVLQHCKRSATHLEKLFASGTGTDATPATMDVEGSVTYYDVMNARELQ